MPPRSDIQEVAKSYVPGAYNDLWTGTVVSTDPATMVVVVAPDGENNVSHVQAISLSSTVASAVGFHETILPGIATKVLCYGRGAHVVIIGQIPMIESQNNHASSSLPNKTILGAADALVKKVHAYGHGTHITKSVVLNNNTPTDTLAGEKVISNEFGVMVGLFKLMSVLRGSELAQVQCHFLDDLVRIISHNFQHYSALGQLSVSHDGKGINLEVGATHRPSESVGSASSQPGLVVDNTEVTDASVPHTQWYGMAPVVDAEGNPVLDNNDNTIDDEQLNMLERMKLFVGKLGGFVNFMLTKPSDETHSLSGTPTTVPDTGLLQVKANLDGTLVVRSVAGIHLEKTNWIRVPQRIRTPEDPTGDDGSTINYDKKDAYEFDNTYTYRDIACLYYLQLRDYLAYINENVGYSDFKKHAKDFNVNDDRTKETPLTNITYVDPETGAKYNNSRSWVSLMPNGGISLSDAWGSAIVMEGGNIYIQPAKDLVVQPNRHLIAKVGGSTSIATRKEVDISSTEGGLRVKTDKAQYYYSDNNGILMHADGPIFGEGVGAGQLDGMVQNVGGIVMYAPNSGINSYGKQVYQYATNSLVSKSDQLLTVKAGTVEVLGNQTVLVDAHVVDILSNSSTTIHSLGNSTLIGLAGTLVGIKDQTIAAVNFMGGEIPVVGLLDPNNIQNAQFFQGLQNIITKYDNYDVAQVLGNFKDSTNFTDIAFQFPSTSVYGLADNEVLPQTVSQQNDDLGLNLLQNWVEKEVNNSYPYPGSDLKTSLATYAVNNIDKTDTTALANKVMGLYNSSADTLTLKNVFTDYKSL